MDKKEIQRKSLENLQKNLVPQSQGSYQQSKDGAGGRIEIKEKLEFLHFHYEDLKETFVFRINHFQTWIHTHFYNYFYIYDGLTPLPLPEEGELRKKLKEFSPQGDHLVLLDLPHFLVWDIFKILEKVEKKIMETPHPHRSLAMDYIRLQILDREKKWPPLYSNHSLFLHHFLSRWLGKMQKKHRKQEGRPYHFLLEVFSDINHLDGAYPLLPLEEKSPENLQIDFSPTKKINTHGKNTNQENS